MNRQTRNGIKESAGLVLRLCVVLYFLSGCVVPPKIPHTSIPFPFAPKAGQENIIDTVPGNISKIKFSATGEFMALLIQDDQNETDRPYGYVPLLNTPTAQRIVLYYTECESPMLIEHPNLTPPGYPIDFAFEKGEKLLIASQVEDGGIELTRVSMRNYTAPPQKLFDHTIPYLDATLSPNGEWIYGRGSDGEWELTHTADEKRVVCFPDPKTIQKKSHGYFSEPMTVVRIIDISPDGELVATELIGENRSDSSTKTVAVWDLKTAREIPLDQATQLPIEPLFVSTFEVQEDSPNLLGTFSPNGQMIAFRSKGRYIAIRQSAGGRLLSELGEHPGKIRAIEFTPLTSKLAAAIDDPRRTMVLWDIRKGIILRSRNAQKKGEKEITAAPVQWIAIKPDNQIVRYTDEDGKIRDWNIRETAPEKK